MVRHNPQASLPRTVTKIYHLESGCPKNKIMTSIFFNVFKCRKFVKMLLFVVSCTGQ